MARYFWIALHSDKNARSGWIEGEASDRFSRGFEKEELLRKSLP
jgi:hypothetical protein